MTESTHYPLLGTVQQGDPHPWHGMVFRARGAGAIRMIDPLDGRPPAPYPYFTSPEDYSPQVSGALWDIGRDDPPPTPQIEAAGGKALGRRVVGPGAYGRMPARLGDMPRPVYLIGTWNDATARLDFMASLGSWAGGGMDLQTFASFSLADLGASPASLRDETGGPLLRYSYSRVTATARWCDSSPDGTRRLYSVHLNGSDDVVDSWGGMVIGIVEVQLAWVDEQLSATASIVRTAPQCLGSYSHSYYSTLRAYGWESVGSPDDPNGALCGSRFVKGDAHPDVMNASIGVSGYTRTTTGVVLSAIYSAGQIRFMTCDVVHQRDDEADASGGDWLGSRQNGQCVVEPRPPTVTVTGGRTVRHRIEISLNGHTVNNEWVYASQNTLVIDRELNENGQWVEVYSGSGTSTVSVDGVILEQLPGGAGGYISRWGWPTPTGLIVPYRATLSGTDFGLAMTEDSTRFGGTKWAGCLAQSRAGQPVWVGPLLHPGGVQGSWVQKPPDDLTGYGAAICPLTGSAVRSVDRQDIYIEGFL